MQSNDSARRTDDIEPMISNRPSTYSCNQEKSTFCTPKEIFREYFRLFLRIHHQRHQVSQVNKIWNDNYLKLNSQSEHSRHLTTYACRANDLRYAWRQNLRKNFSQIWIKKIFLIKIIQPSLVRLTRYENGPFTKLTTDGVIWCKLNASSWLEQTCSTPVCETSFNENVGGNSGWKKIGE